MEDIYQDFQPFFVQFVQINMKNVPELVKRYNVLHYPFVVYVKPESRGKVWSRYVDRRFYENYLDWMQTKLRNGKCPTVKKPEQPSQND